MTLQEKARKSKGRTEAKIGPQQIELALGWAKGDYGIAAVNEALGRPRVGQMSYVLLARSLREAVSQGRLVDKGEPGKTREYP